MKITIGSFRPFLNYKFKAGQKMYVPSVPVKRKQKLKTETPSGI